MLVFFPKANPQQFNELEAPVSYTHLQPGSPEIVCDVGAGIPFQVPVLYDGAVFQVTVDAVHIFVGIRTFTVLRVVSLDWSHRNSFASVMDEGEITLFSASVNTNCIIICAG